MKKIYILGFISLFSALQAKTIQYQIAKTNTLLTITEADITKQRVDAIVNPANDLLSHYGTLAKKISDSAGSKLQKLCYTFPIENGKRCPTGQVVITPGFNLPANRIFHAVGPKVASKNPTKKDVRDLKRVYESIMKKAKDSHLSSIAIPSISTGAFGYPITQAAPIAIHTIISFIQDYKPKSLHEIRIILWDQTKDYAVYKKALSPFVNKNILRVL